MESGTWEKIYAELSTVSNKSMLFEHQHTATSIVSADLCHQDTIQFTFSFGQLVRQFQLALFRYSKEGSPPLYDAKAMRTFSDIDAPGSFMYYQTNNFNCGK